MLAMGNDEVRTVNPQNETYLGAIWGRRLRTSEILVVSRDPAVLVRSSRFPIATAPAAAGGLSIPVAMHGYRQRRI